MDKNIFPKQITEWLNRADKQPGEYVSTTLIIEGVDYPASFVVDEQGGLAICARLPNIVLLSEHAAEALFQDIGRMGVGGLVNFSFDSKSHQVFAELPLEDDILVDRLTEIAMFYRALSTFLEKVAKTGMWSDREIIFDLTEPTEAMWLH